MTCMGSCRGTEEGLCALRILQSHPTAPDSASSVAPVYSHQNGDGLQNYSI